MPAPIGFSECLSHDIDTTYFVEWLSDDQSFPSLPPSSMVNKSKDTLDWQFISEKEVDQAKQEIPGLTIKSVRLHSEKDCLAEFEAEFWEHIDYANCQPPKSYVELATNAQDQLADVHQLQPFPPIHPHLNRHPLIDNTTRSDTEGTDMNDDWYHLYAEHKSHGSHSHFGNKHYIKRQRDIVVQDLNNCWRIEPLEITPRILYQSIAFRTHAKQYKPPGPRNANKNKVKGLLHPCARLTKLPPTFVIKQ